MIFLEETKELIMIFVASIKIPEKKVIGVYGLVLDF